MQSKKLIRLFCYLGILFVTVFSSGKAESFAFEDRVAMAKSLSHYAMGQIYDLYGESSMAVLEYEKAAQFDKSSYIIHLRLGVDYARLNMLTDALKELKLVSRYNPADLQSHYLAALIYSTQKDYDNAAVEYEYILKTFSDVEPQNIEIYGYLGQLYYSQKKYDKAIEQFENIHKLELRNSDVMYLLGSLYLEVGEREKAIEILNNSIDVNPKHDGSLNTLGYIYAEGGYNLDQAIELILRALEVSPNNGAYLDSLGWVYFKKGLYEKALEVFFKADEVLNDPVIYSHIGDVYYQLNNMDEALKYWKLSLELLPDQDDIVKKIESIENTQARN